MIVYLTIIAAPLASPFGGGGRASARSERDIALSVSPGGLPALPEGEPRDAQINDHLYSLCPLKMDERNAIIYS